MSGNELGQPRPKNEFKLLIPGLTPLYEGVFEDVYGDYLNDPQGFLVALRYRMETENPALVPAVFFPLSSEEGAKWVAVYYEMFARSAKREGFPPMIVARDLVDHQAKTRILVREPVVFGNDINRLEELHEKDRAEIERRIARDRNFSEELIKFWNMVDQYLSSHEDEEGGYLAEAELIPLYGTQRLLQGQNDSYDLAARDIHGLL